MNQFGSWTTAKAVEKATESLARLEALGLKPTAGNRLERSRDLLRQVVRFTPPIGPADPELHRSVLEASRTVLEHHLIISNLEPLTAEAAVLVRKMLGGQIVPIEDRFDPARDAQAELFTGVLFRAAGYHVDIAEPDLVISRGAARLGVAVKRVTSTKQFQRRVKKAQDQLVAQNLDGFLVVAADGLIPGLESSSPGERLTRGAERWVSYLEGRAGYDRVTAVVALATSFRLLRPGRDFLLGLSIHFYPLYLVNDDPKSASAVEAVGAAMRKEMIAGLKRAGSSP